MRKLSPKPPSRQLWLRRLTPATSACVRGSPQITCSRRPSRPPRPRRRSRPRPSRRRTPGPPPPRRRPESGGAGAGRPRATPARDVATRARAGGPAADPEPAPDEPAPKRPRAASELSGGPYKRPKGRAPGKKLWDSHAGQWVLPTDEPAEPYAPAADATAAYDDDVGEAAEALGEPVGDEEISRGEILAEGIALPEVGSIPIVAAVPVPMEDEEGGGRGGGGGRGRIVRWTDDEEVRLRELVTEFGTRGQAWPVIAERLGTGRTHAAVEQHWQIMIGKRKRNGQSNLPARRPSLGSDDGAAAAAASISPRDQLEANRAAGPEPHQAKRARKGKLARVTLKVGADGTVGVRARATPVKAMPSAPPVAPGAPPKPPTACMLFVKERQAAHAAARTLNAETGVECTPTERYNLAMNEWKEAGRTPPADAALAERKRTLEAQQKAARDEWRALQPPIPVVPVERGGGDGRRRRGGAGGGAAAAQRPRALHARADLRAPNLAAVDDAARAVRAGERRVEGAAR